MNRPLYGVLLIVTILCAVGGLLTLLPVQGASYENVLGYRSLCTFAPAATLFCFTAAGITCTIRASLVKRAAYNNGKPVFRAQAFVALVVVIGLGIASMIWFLNVKTQFADAETAATELVE